MMIKKNRQSRDGKENRLGGTGGFSRTVIRIELILLLALGSVCIVRELLGRWQESSLQGEDMAWTSEDGQAIEVTADGNYIKWVEFHVTCEAMAAAYDLDVETYKDKIHLNWIELLAYVGAKNGGKFDKNSVREIQKAAEKLRNGETSMEELTEDMEYYEYYLEAYTAVLGGMVGEFALSEVAGEAAEKFDAAQAAQDSGRAAGEAAQTWHHYYGLKAFSPIAAGFDYSHYDDFGSSRSYGYRRPHLGHDMMGMIGTPRCA